MNSKLSHFIADLPSLPKHLTVISAELADVAHQNSLTNDMSCPGEASGLAKPVNQQSLNPSHIISVSKSMTFDFISAHKAL